MAVGRQLVAEGHDTIEANFILVAAHRSLADLDKAAKENAKALKQYNEALAIARPLAMDMAPSDARYVRAWRNVTSLLRNISVQQQQLGDTAGAESSFRESLSIRRRLYESNPDEDTSRDYGIILNNQGSRQSQSGQFEAALASYEQALKLRQEADRRWPDSTTRRDLSWSNWFVGDAMVKLDRDAEASAYYTTAVELMTEDCNRNPGDDRSPRHLGSMIAELSKPEYEQAFTGPDALKACQEALEVKDLSEETRSQLKQLVARVSKS